MTIGESWKIGCMYANDIGRRGRGGGWWGGTEEKRTVVLETLCKNTRETTYRVLKKAFFLSHSNSFIPSLKQYICTVYSTNHYGPMAAHWLNRGRGAGGVGILNICRNLRPCPYFRMLSESSFHGHKNESEMMNIVMFFPITGTLHFPLSGDS